MNAKELAGSISRFVGQIKPTNNPSDDAVIKGFPEWFIEDLENSATMLRQQADRIVELEADVKKKLVMIGLWEAKFKELAEATGFAGYLAGMMVFEDKTPQIKELSDEEIEECYWGDGYPDNPRHPKEFAYAILRKAWD